MASGVREHDLVARAKVLRESVDSLLPRLTATPLTTGSTVFGPTWRRSGSARDDARRLEKMARRGDSIPRAYAGLLAFYLDPKTPTVVAFPLPGARSRSPPSPRRTARRRSPSSSRTTPADCSSGTWSGPGRASTSTPPARRSGAPAALRDPPGRRLWPSGLRSSRTAPSPTRAATCSRVRISPPTRRAPTWRSAGRAPIGRSASARKCAKDDRHLLSVLSDDAAVPDPASAFPVEVELNVECRGGPECVHADLPPLPKKLRRDYEFGRLSDAALLDAYRTEVRPAIEGTRRTTLVAGGICYGEKMGDFLDALHPTAVERRALEAALAGSRGYFEVDEPAASRALERLWPQHAEEIVGAITEDETEARRALQEARDAPGAIAEILKRAQRRGEERELLEALPHYSRLTNEAAWVDRVARAYRTHREAGAERTLLQTLPREGKERGLAYAFLLALGRASSHAWQFTPTEQEFGASLAGPARTLLDSAASGVRRRAGRVAAECRRRRLGVREPTA